MSENKKVAINEFWSKLGIATCTLPEAKIVIKELIKARLPSCLIGEAGIGKSQLARQIAAELDMDFLAFFAAHNEREDIIGIPFPDKDGEFYSFLVEKNIHAIVNSKRPVLLVFDEWNRGDKAVMNAIFTVMEDRKLGSQKLPDHVHIMACMNPSEDAYNVNEAEKDPAFRRRLAFLAVQANEVAWLEHATKVGFHSAVIDFVRAKPTMLNDTLSREAGKVYANPAGWEKVSNILKSLESEGQTINAAENRRKLYIMLSGIIGTGVANDFLQFIEDNYSLITPKQIISEYSKVKSKLLAWAKGGAGGINRLQQTFESLALYIVTERPSIDEDSATIDNLVAFLGDMPRDLQVLQQLFIKMEKYSSQISNHAEYSKYINALSHTLSINKKWQQLLVDDKTAVSKVRDAKNNANG